jgi:hypothetical protein
VNLYDVEPRITIFPDPELHPSVHTLLSEMFSEARIKPQLVNSAATPTDLQWMVKERYGLALIDQTLRL